MSIDNLELVYEAIDSLNANIKNDKFVIYDELNDTIRINDMVFHVCVRKTLSNANIYSAIKQIKEEGGQRFSPHNLGFQ